MWTEGGRTWRVVGLVENPLNLLDQFALVAPGQAHPPAQVSDPARRQPAAASSRSASRAAPASASEAARTASKAAAEVVVLVLGTLGLLFVGLMGVAGFTVMAQRRLRALGMLGALGATDRHVRLVMLANGAAVGVTAAVVGAAVGLVAWLAFVPTLQSIAEHRIDRFALPWWAIARGHGPHRRHRRGGRLVAGAGRWPGSRSWPPCRGVRPARSRPIASPPSAASLLGAGLVLLAFADQRRAGFIIGGTVATAVGLLFLAPLAIRALAAAGRPRDRRGPAGAARPGPLPGPLRRGARAPSPSPSASPPPSPSARPRPRHPTRPATSRQPADALPHSRRTAPATRFPR